MRLAKKRTCRASSLIWLAHTSRAAPEGRRSIMREAVISAVSSPYWIWANTSAAAWRMARGQAESSTADQSSFATVHWSRLASS